MPAITDADIAQMPRIADATLAKALHWPMSEEERLYHDCPTAFWLAPDAEDVLPPVDGPAPAIVPAAQDEDLPAPLVAEGILSAIGFGLAVAGSIFIAGLGLIESGLGTPIDRIVKGLALGLFSAPLSIPFGGVAAAVPVLLGVSILAWLGTGHAVARRRSLWAATGAGMGLLIAALFDAGMVTVPLVLTSIACASVAHLGIDWVEPEAA